MEQFIYWYGVFWLGLTLLCGFVWCVGVVSAFALSKTADFDLLAGYLYHKHVTVKSAESTDDD